MQGLLTQQQAPAGENVATPEEEQLMEQALEEVGKMIYASDSAADSLLQTISKSDPPEVGIGIVVSQVVDVTDQKMDLPDDFIVPLSEAVTYMIVEMADKAGIAESNDDLIERSLAETAKNIAQDFGVASDVEGIGSAMQDAEIASETERVGGLYAQQK